MQRLLNNPEFMRIAITAAIGTFLFIFIVGLGFFFYRKLRKDLRAEGLAASSTRISEDNSSFSLAAYEGVIRKLKDQEKELERLRKSERERAFESASMSEAVLSNLGSGVLFFSTAGLVRQANPAARSLLGYASPSGLHARDIFRGAHEIRFPVPPATDSALASLADQSAVQSLVTAVEHSIKLGLSFRRLEADYKTPDGTARVLGVTISPVKGPAGDSLGAAVLLSDLTEITHLSRQIRLRENMASLGEMSAGIAHEFKNSLATISGYAQMLSSNSSPDAPFAAKINSETASLSRIVNDFLNFARPQGFAQESVEIVSVLRDCAEECRVRLELTGQTDSAIVTADPTALRQAFSNLLRNSAEAVTDGHPALVRVAIAALKQPTGDALRLTITDNGPGIPAELLPRIFVPFFTTKASGTGLGLALVHRIVTEQGGTIQVETSPSGATFTLTLPRAKNPAISG
ncbi:MAG TPA: ATP-binding protein [Terriglobales bacterium]|nr:ATP-binding protein [Terriglobales bacterium]